MHAFHRSRPVAALTLCLLMLAGTSACGTPSPSTPGASAPAPTATSTPAPTASPTATPTADPLPDVQLYTTENGSATFEVPAAWSLEESGTTGSNGNPPCRWINIVTLTQGDVTLEYADTDLADAAGGMLTWRILTSVPVGDDAIAATWWMRYDESTPVIAQAGLLPANTPIEGTGEAGMGIPSELWLDPGRVRFSTERVEFATVEEAEAYLASGDIAAAMDVIETWRLTGTPGDLPDGVSC